jgi:RNA polymerase primary sigma factor
MRQLKISTKITNRDSQSLEKYLQEINKIPMISPEEEVLLAQKIKKGDQQALEKLTKANLRFVVSVAKQYQGQGMTLPDLINEGNLGLIKAASRFDETLGFKFISYAVWWIRQSILIALAEQSRIVRMPLNKIGLKNKANRAIQTFSQQYERDPSNEELAALLDLEEYQIDGILQCSIHHISLDQPINSEDSGDCLGDLLAGGMESDEKINADSLRQEIDLVLNRLTPRESELVYAYYGFNKEEGGNFETIIQKYNLTKDRALQIKKRAIGRLQNKKNSARLKTYL